MIESWCKEYVVLFLLELYRGMRRRIRFGGDLGYFKKLIKFADFYEKFLSIQIREHFHQV